MPTFAIIDYWSSTHCVLGTTLGMINGCVTELAFLKGTFPMLTLFVKGSPILKQSREIDNEAQFLHCLYSLRRWYCNSKKSINASSDLPTPLLHHLDTQIYGSFEKSLMTFLPFASQNYINLTCFPTLNVEIKSLFYTLFVLLGRFMLRKKAKDVFEAITYQVYRNLVQTVSSY